MSEDLDVFGTGMDSVAVVAKSTTIGLVADALSTQGRRLKAEAQARRARGDALAADALGATGERLDGIASALQGFFLSALLAQAGAPEARFVRVTDEQIAVIRDSLERARRVGNEDSIAKLDELIDLLDDA